MRFPAGRTERGTDKRQYKELLLLSLLLIRGNIKSYCGCHYYSKNNILVPVTNIKTMQAMMVSLTLENGTAPLHPTPYTLASPPGNRHSSPTPTRLNSLLLWASRASIPLSLPLLTVTHINLCWRSGSIRAVGLCGRRSLTLNPNPYNRRSSPTPTRLNPQLSGSMGVVGSPPNSDLDSGFEGELDSVEQVSFLVFSFLHDKSMRIGTGVWEQ